MGVMLYEHQLSRFLTGEMADALAIARAGDAPPKSRFLRAARQYVQLLTNHICKEDNVLLNMGDRMMSPMIRVRWPRNSVPSTASREPPDATTRRGA